jgi:uncharacterized protein (DUF885 family)
MKKHLSIITLLVLTACGQAPKENENNTSTTSMPQKKAQSESERLNQWFEEKYEEKLLQSPMALTTLGRKERYDELDDFSEAAADKSLKWQADSVAELKSTFN